MSFFSSPGGHSRGPIPIALFALAALAAGDAPAIVPLVLPLNEPLAATLAPLAVLGVDMDDEPDIAPLGCVVVLEDV